MRFTIRNNALVSLSCNMSPPLTLAAAPPVSIGSSHFKTMTG